MVQPSLKCVLCNLNKSQFLLLNEEFLGRSLLAIITNLCNNEVNDNIKSTDNACAECAMELWRTEKMLTQVRHTFARKKATTAKVKAEDTTTDADSYTFQCKSCDFNTTQIRLFKTHMLKLHGKTIQHPYVCEECEMSFNRLDHFNRHKEKQHAQQEGKVNELIKFTIKMAEPEKKLKKLAAVEKKLKKSADAEKKQKSVVNSIKVENNTVNQTTKVVAENLNGDIIFRCVECTYGTDKPKVFRRHMMTIHKYDKNECFRCGICGKNYSMPIAFKNHMQKHRGLPLGLNASLNKQTTMISEQTLNNAKATSTPLNAEKLEKKKKKELTKVVNSTPQPKAVEKLQNVESTLKKKKKRTLEETATPAVEAEQEEIVVAPKKKKLFEKIKDNSVIEATTLLNSTVEQDGEEKETYACHLCTKVASSQKKLQKHLLKKHAA